MLILQNILSQEIVQRLGWTLLHFIWQAAAVALILTILLRVLRKSTANLRYIIACLALSLIVLLPVITIQLVPVSQPLTATHFASAPAPTVLPAVEMPAPETIVIAKPYQPESVPAVPAIPFKQRAVNALEPALPYIVSGWLIGVFGLSLWHLGGWTQLQRLKRRMVKQVDSTLQSNLKVLIQKLKVKQTVQLMESALVQIPTVVGWLRPVILLPASALTGLNTEQLEAIIAHELAHIKRLDYLINILQTVAEILGFYHPAVWWVSHKIRAERENCCDDIAVSISGDRVSYAGALASMEEIRAAHGKLAVAASGGNLFRRICRLLGKDSTDSTGLSWIPAATAILLIIALAIPTTLALTSKTNSMPTETKTDIQVEDDILIETSPDEESPTENIPPDPAMATSPAPPDEDKAQVVKANFLVIEVPLDSKIDNNTLKEAEKILGDKVSLRDSRIDNILRQVTQATTEAMNESDSNKRVTEQQFNSLVKMLDSKGCLKILMNPMIETINGKTATIRSAQQVPLQQITKAFPGGGGQLNQAATEIEYVDVVDLIEITPHVHADGHISLVVEADLGSRNIPVFEELTTPVSSRHLSTQVRANPGESLIISYLTENPLSPGDITNNAKRQANEVLFILTPTIVTPPADSQKTAETQIEAQKILSAHKLKLLGLAVAMYANDHDNKLPDTLEPLKPYIANEQDYLWLQDNVEYALKETKYFPNQPHIPIAYDKTQKEKQSGINVLFLDGHVEFLTPQRLSKLDIKRVEILIETWFLAVNKDFIENINHNADFPDEAKELFKLKSELLAAVDGSNKSSFISPERNVGLLLKAVRAHKDSYVLAAPKINCLEGKSAKITTAEKRPILTGYTEPNKPSEKPQPKFDYVDTGFTMSLSPKLTPNKNIDMQFELEITQVLDFEKHEFKGKTTYMPRKVETITQATHYIAKNGQTLLCWGHKIANPQAEQDLLILIKAQAIDSSEQDKPTKAENLIVTEPKIIQTRTEKPKNNEQEKTKPATDAKLGDIPTISEDYPLAMVENKDQVIQKLFKLENYSPSQMGQIILPLVGDYGYVSADEDTGSLLVIDTVKSLMRIELIIEQFDVPKAGQTVTKIFALKHHDTSQMARIVSPLLTKTGHVSKDERTNSLIVSDTAENMTRIEKIIAQFDVSVAEQAVQKSFKLKYRSPSQMAQILKPLLTKTGHVSADENTGNLLVIDTVENLKRIEVIITEYDVPKVDETVIEIFEIRNGDPVEIVELLKKLINGRPETPSVIESGKEPIVLIPEPRRKWIIAKASAEDIKQIGQWIEKLDTDKSTIGLDPIDKAVHEQLETIVDLSNLTPGTPFGEVVEKLENSVEPPLQIQPIWKDLLENAEVEQATPAGMDPLPRVKLRKALEILITSVTSSQLGEFGELTYAVDDGVILIGTLAMLPPKFDGIPSSPDELPEPNLPPAPKVPLISNTFIDCPLLDALEYIAAAANVTIIPDETIVGNITCTLKDVTVETTLDIILAGTPYLWKKTPHYYLVAVASAVDLSEIKNTHGICQKTFQPRQSAAHLRKRPRRQISEFAV